VIAGIDFWILIHGVNLFDDDRTYKSYVLKITKTKINNISIIDKHQHMHFTFNNILVYNADFNVKIHKNT